MKAHMSTDERVEQIRRAHKSARPNLGNIAWMNCHQDCGILLEKIARLQKVHKLAAELCDAVDAEEQDVGGHRGSRVILGELGPAVEAAK